MLETVGRIVGRMAELKGMATQDPLKSSQDGIIHNEFADLANNFSIFRRRPSMGQACLRFVSTEMRFCSIGTRIQRKMQSSDHTIDIIPVVKDPADKAKLHKSAYSQALTIDASALTTTFLAGANGLLLVYFSIVVPEELPLFLSMRVDYQWACSNRQFPILHIFEHSQAAACPD